MLELAEESPPSSERMCCICGNKIDFGELGEWKKRRSRLEGDCQREGEKGVSV